ncbi:hybrid histidine kinase/response regulator HrmK [Chrysosporum bergii ANA360D]|uniref:Circadian input-output histidine kinase CikA n=1 Tax=Chrysosporum bergii ANA360D TaxID=617107 RepID=A0AA43GST6_9CYAN|nr:hybrid histidine kinase/response regulator HrmK [Chrysosporum bergii]MDH6061044.1 hybrid histidine kinase/response regulator HrmK [Chrysosporum bergii ANA360D]
MQQYSSLPEQNSSANETPTLLTTMQQLRAELWLERSLNRLQSRLSDCLLSLCSNVSQSKTTEAEIFQTLVNELGMALNSVTVAIALLQPQTNMAQICYVSSPPSPQSISIENKGQKLQWQLQAVIATQDLQQMESQQPNHVQSLTDDVGSVIGWLIISQTGSKSHGKSLTPWPSSLMTQLLRRAIQQCVTALVQTRKIQSLQQHAQQLERSNQLKNQFLANTSHEIRTPLSSIIGFSQLILAQGYDSSRENHQEYLKIIESSGKHLITLINDILDLSKIEANQLEVEWESINVPELCRNVLSLVKEKAANKGLKLQLILHPDVTTLAADPLRVKQMLWNLLSNAFKFTNTGTVGLEVLPKDEFIHFIVWDTGIGISPENQRRLFEPFFQIANPVAHRSEGSGLGLTVTQKLAEIHGGWLQVESQVDQGSRFTIILPMKPAGEAGKYQEDVDQIRPVDQEVYQEDEKAQTYLDILLVENDLANGELIRIYLGTLGYTVTWVKNAAEMWSALTQVNPMVILMDIRLPDGNGLQLVQQLREEAKYQKIPVIVQTAMAMKGDRETCLAAGVDDYISKPIDLSLLANLVAKYCKAMSI